MVYCTYRKHGIKIKRAWFINTYDFNEDGKHSLVILHNVKNKLNNENIVFEQKQTTLITDLNPTEEEILNNFNSGVRNEVRRAKKEGVVCKEFTSSMLKGDSSILKRFNEEYIKMYREKNQPVKSLIPFLISYLEAGILTITIAVYNAEPVAYHIYILDKKEVILLYSVSVFRESEDIKLKGLIGKANRFLHYSDMLYFKDIGIRVYDWGGYSNKEHLKGISTFKKGFGGTISEYYAYNICNSSMLRFIYNIKNKFS